MSPRALTGLDVKDLTFYGLDAGWALASAPCPGGVSKSCTVLLHTTDGVHWKRRLGAPFAVLDPSGRCTGHCVTNIRFADQAVGYAYGPSVFYLTTDGGANWTRQPGGALALETLNGNVIRVVATADGCPGPCDLEAQTAPIGGTTWKDHELSSPSNQPSDGVELSRNGPDAYVLVVGRKVAGVSYGTSTMYRSVNNGNSWHSFREPCGQPANGVRYFGVAVDAAEGGRVAVACKIHQVGFGATVDVSSDRGFRYTIRGELLLDGNPRLAGDPAGVLVIGGDRVLRSVDGGRSWTTITQITGIPTFVGFESPTVARVITESNKLWTTRDGGVTWTESSFT